MKYKFCRRCERDVSTADFNNDSNTVDGLRAYCRTCHREQARDYYKQNAVKMQEAMARWVAAHRVRSREIKRQWEQRNPAALRERTRRRRARRRGAAVVEHFSAAEIFERDFYTCYLCGYVCALEASSRWQPTVDHVIALDSGGNHTKDNCRTTHRCCNSAKGIKSVEEYLGFSLS